MNAVHINIVIIMLGKCCIEHHTGNAISCNLGKRAICLFVGMLFVGRANSHLGVLIIMTNIIKSDMSQIG